MSEKKEERVSKNFIQEIIEKDLAAGTHEGRVHMRFPPEPNGYLHIGHAKAIWINFETAKMYGGKTNLRFDDTNPVKEDVEYVNSIKKDISWLGYEWEGEALYTSDYFEQLYQYAEELIKKGVAYIDEQSAEEIAAQKGTPTQAGTNSPFRDRSVDENLEKFREMRAGKHPDGTMILRAKIDMAAPNMLMRDPLIYRIKHAHHHNTGDAWCIYPMYDFAHGQSDSIENITHSCCSLEFMHHRPLYDWFIEQLGIFPSKQYEFARMNVAYMITSKRRLLKLVENELVSGWDDPRMSTLSGMRRRGYLPESIRKFCALTGVQDESAGEHMMTFSREIWIEKGDFMLDPPKKYFRLAPDKHVRLKGAYIIKADKYITDENGEVTEVHCTYFPESKSGSDNSGTIDYSLILHRQVMRIKIS